MKSLKIDKEYYKKKYISLIKKKLLSIVTEILLGSGSAITTSTMSLINPSIGIVLTSSTALITTIRLLMTIEYISKLKIRFTKLRDWIVLLSLLYEKTLKESVIDEKHDVNEAEEIKKVYNHYLNKRTEKMKNTQIKVEDVFGNVISKNSISPKLLTKLKKI